MDAGFTLSNRDNFLKVVPRDPGCLFIFWEIGERESDISARVMGGIPVAACKWVLRVNCLGTNKTRDFEVDREAGNWYLKCEPDTEYFVELGLRPSQGGFEVIVNSGSVKTPPVGISSAIDPYWPVSLEHFLRLVPMESLPFMRSSFERYTCENAVEWISSGWPLAVDGAENEVQKRPEPIK